MPTMTSHRDLTEALREAHATIRRLEADNAELRREKRYLYAHCRSIGFRLEPGQEASLPVVDLLIAHPGAVVKCEKIARLVQLVIEPGAAVLTDCRIEREVTM